MPDEGKEDFYMHQKNCIKIQIKYILFNPNQSIYPTFMPDHPGFYPPNNQSIKIFTSKQLSEFFTLITTIEKRTHNYLSINHHQDHSTITQINQPNFFKFKPNPLKSHHLLHQSFLQQKSMGSHHSTKTPTVLRKNPQHNFSLNKINKKIDLLCLGELNCHYTDFLMEYTGQLKDENPVQNIYVKRMKDKVIFFHQWKQLDEMQVQQPFDGLVFFVDLAHHLNNTPETVLKHVQTLSVLSGVNVFRIPVTLIALNGSTLLQKQFEYQKRRLEKHLNCILDEKQILYYSSGIKENFTIISDKLQRFVSMIFENEPQSIKSSWSAYWKLYGLGDTLQAFGNDVTISYMGWKERLFQKRDHQQITHSDETNEHTSVIKKLW